MAKTIDLVQEKSVIEFGNDNIVIQKYISGIKGGRVLDTTGYTDKVIRAGHVIIKTAEGEYAPLGVEEDKYAALPEGASYVGVLYGSILTAKPSAAIMTNGEVNKVAMPYQFAEGAESAFITATQGNIAFVEDIEG